MCKGFEHHWITVTALLVPRSPANTGHSALWYDFWVGCPFKPFWYTLCCKGHTLIIHTPLVINIHIVSLLPSQAQGKGPWQKLFSHFCSRAANEEEEMAHKLLGEQFRVRTSVVHNNNMQCDFKSMSPEFKIYLYIIWSSYLSILITID